jgi:hypothetical protein
MITQLATAGAQMLIAALTFKMRPNMTITVKLAVFIVVVIFTGYLSRFFDNRLAGYALTIAVPLLFAFSIQLINLGDLFRIIKKEI